MSQSIFDSIDPAMSGTDLAGVLNDFKAALMSGLSGTSRPTELEPGGFWVDTGAESSSGTWSFKLWTGTDDVEVFKIDLVAGGAAVSLAVDAFTVRKVSADDVGPLLELVKRRIATNGQVLNGDVVGEIRVVGRQDTGGNPVVAKIIYTAEEDQTATAFGGTFSFWSTPAGSATMIEHMKFVGGIIESIVPHKVNALQLAAQSIASVATIAQLNTDKSVIEITGNTETTVQGINSTGKSKTITIINTMSSAKIILSPNDAGAVAEDRIVGGDSILPGEAAQLVYSTSQSRWLIASAAFHPRTLASEKFEFNDTWVAPEDGIVEVIARDYQYLLANNGSYTYFVDKVGRLFAIGRNDYLFILGLGDLVSRSSPTLVVGPSRYSNYFNWNKVSTIFSKALSDLGQIVSWGSAANGALGDGTLVSKSSPVIVSGSLNVKKLIVSAGTYAITDSGVYYFGQGTNGASGLGDVNSRSTPTLIAGTSGAKDIFGLSSNAVFMLKENGELYSWAGGSSGVTGRTISVSTPTLLLSGVESMPEFNIRLGKYQQTRRLPNISTTVMYATLNNGDLYVWGGGGTSAPAVGIPGASVPVSPSLVLAGAHIDLIICSGPTSAPGYDRLALSKDGDVYAWGPTNTTGGLGVGVTGAVSSPTFVMGGVKYICSVGANNTATNYFLKRNGELWGCGNNSMSQLQTGDTINRSTPVLIMSGVSRIVGDEQQNLGIFAQKMDGSVWFWGAQINGSGGVNTSAISVSSPTVLMGSSPILVLSSTNGRVFGVLNEQIYSWGNNSNGELGHNDNTPKSTPTLVVGGYSPKLTQTVNSFRIPVTKGSSYPVIVYGAGIKKFGNVELGSEVSEIEINYET